MPTGDATDAAIGIQATDPSLALGPDMKHEGPKSAHAVEKPPVIEGQATAYRYDDFDEEEVHGEFPTEEEFHALRRVSDKIPWRVYTIAFVELCERFSYYGTTVVCKF